MDFTIFQIHILKTSITIYLKILILIPTIHHQYFIRDQIKKLLILILWNISLQD